jgi:hypothetical protein
MAYGALGNLMNNARHLLEPEDIKLAPVDIETLQHVSSMRLNPFPVFSSNYVDAVGDAAAFSVPWGMGRTLLSFWNVNKAWPPTVQLLKGCGKSMMGSTALVSSVFVYDLITRSYIQTHMSQNFIAMWYGPLQWIGASSLALLAAKATPFALLPTWASLIENVPRTARFVSKPNSVSDWFMKNVYTENPQQKSIL